jgi:hypothetical protein
MGKFFFTLNTSSTRFHGRQRHVPPRPFTSSIIHAMRSSGLRSPWQQTAVFSVRVFGALISAVPAGHDFDAKISCPLP